VLLAALLLLVARLSMVWVLTILAVLAGAWHLLI
jgi:chromate transporter